jgi:hypothetical protein
MNHQKNSLIVIVLEDISMSESWLIVEKESRLIKIVRLLVVKKKFEV